MATAVISAAGRSRSTASRERSGSPRASTSTSAGSARARRRSRRRTALPPGPCLVNAGGDVAVRGRRWPVGVETANGFVTLELISGALATSGRDRRRWRRDGLGAAPPDRPGDRPPVWLRPPSRHGGRARPPPRPKCSRSRSSSPESENAVLEAERDGIAAVLITADGRTLLDGRARMKDPTFWFIARASGLTAYALLTCSVLMGLLVKARPFRRLRQPPP